MTQTLVPIRYIGHKPLARDNVLGRINLKWSGHGDVQWVPEEDARVYVRYQDVWAVAEDMRHVSVDPVTYKPIIKESSATEDSSAGAGINTLPVGDVDLSDDDSVAEDPPPQQGLDKFSAEDQRERLEKIIRAYPKLPRRAFGNDGKPATKHIQRKVGFYVYAEERDAAHAAIQASINREPDPASGQLPSDAGLE
jgi:hypothetical protein